MVLFLMKTILSICLLKFGRYVLANGDSIKNEHRVIQDRLYNSDLDNFSNGELPFIDLVTSK